MDFDEHPEDKIDFVMYAVELRCLDLVLGTKKTPLPPLEDLAEATTILHAAGLQPNKEPRKDLEKILQKEGTIKTLFPIHHGPCDRHYLLNTHVGARGVMTPGRIQDSEGAKGVVISFKSATGAILAVKGQPFKIGCFSDIVSGRLRVDPDATAGGRQDP